MDDGCINECRWWLYSLKNSIINCEDSTTLWEEPDISSAELCQIPLGAAVNVLQGAPNGFVQVDYNGMTGFCLGSYLSEIQ